jgi:hypothetical protein
VACAAVTDSAIRGLDGAWLVVPEAVLLRLMLVDGLGDLLLEVTSRLHSVGRDQMVVCGLDDFIALADDLYRAGLLLRDLGAVDHSRVHIYSLSVSPSGLRRASSPVDQI